MLQMLLGIKFFAASQVSLTKKVAVKNWNGVGELSTKKHKKLQTMPPQ